MSCSVFFFSNKDHLKMFVAGEQATEEDGAKSEKR